jgi:hypothetical protein
VLILRDILGFSARETAAVLEATPHDVDAVVALLAEDARMAMPPLPSWYSARDQVAPSCARTPSPASNSGA